MIPDPTHTYYARNYAGIIAASLMRTGHKEKHSLTKILVYTFLIYCLLNKI